MNEHHHSGGRGGAAATVSTHPTHATGRLVLLAVTLAVGFVWAPVTLSEATADQAGASALYMQN